MKQLIITIVFSLITSAGCLYAQNSPDSVLWDLVKTYRDIKGLSCDIQYKYADEKSPDKYLDSLQGKYITLGADVWFEIDQTVNIRNNEYSIAIFKEDKIIYVNAPTDSKSIRDPLGAIDSLYKYDPSARSTVRDDKTQWELVLDMPKNMACKKITYLIDKKTGLLKKTIAVVSTAMLYEAGAAPAESKDQFSNIETVYTNYKIGNVDPEVFKTDSYISKQADELRPSRKFDSYQIVKAKPKL